MESSSQLLCLSILTFLFFTLSSSASTNQETPFLTCLSKQPHTSPLLHIITSPTLNPSSFSSLHPPQFPRPESTQTPLKPLLILTPAHVPDLQASVRCATKLNIHLRTRSGGHDYESLSSTSRSGPFVLVDLRNLSSITIDTPSRTAWVQTGATVGQLYYALSKNNQTLTFPAGVCPTVGIGGHLSGGGYGMLARMHGLAADHFLDATLIDVNGNVLNRGSMGEDVFWALGGGGSASFGIILAFKINLVPVPDIVTPFVISRIGPNVAELVHKWQLVAEKADEKLMLRVSMNSVVDKETKNRTILLTFVGLYLGRANEVLALMKRVFPELGLAEKECEEMSWIESVMLLANLRGKPLEALLSRTPQEPYVQSFYKGKSDFVARPMPVSGFERVWRFLDEEEESRGALEFSPFGGQLSKFSESETPFPHRKGNIYMIRYGVVWEKEGDEELEKHLSWIRRLYGYMERYVTKEPRAAYFNYKDLDIGMNKGDGNTSFSEASVWGRKYYKGNFDRLVRAKTKVDPSNFFRNEQSIPLLN